MNTSNLNTCVQGKNMDIITLRKNAEMTIETLNRCRNDEDCKNLWELAINLGEKLKPLIKDYPNFEFKDPATPRLRKVPLRLQALVGEEGSEYAVVREPIDQYRIEVYFMSLDLIVTELVSIF